MAGNWRQVVRGGIVAAFVGAGLVLALGRGQTAPDGVEDREKDTVPPKANVFVYPDKLTDKDKLRDGPGDPIPITSETTLIWVDLAPDYRFAHPTEYVLISPKGTQVVKGHWWPVLNGKHLFPNTTPYKAEFPMKLVGK